MRDNSRAIVLDTLAKLYAHGHGINGYCCTCRRYFRVPIPVLIAVRGADSPVVGIRPLRYAGCGGREAEIRVTAPSKAAPSSDAQVPGAESVPDATKEWFREGNVTDAVL
jgi:hypothetical protein